MTRIKREAIPDPQLGGNLKRLFLWGEDYYVHMEEVDPEDGYSVEREHYYDATLVDREFAKCSAELTRLRAELAEAMELLEAASDIIQTPYYDFGEEQHKNMERIYAAVEKARRAPSDTD